MSTKRKPSRHRMPPGEMLTLDCAFCKCTGRDPYEILSRLSKCPVCNGRTEVEVMKPAYPCAHCDSTGRQHHTRLTCSACKGTGHVTVAGPTAQCPECRGSGTIRGADLPCSFCRGAGLIAARSTLDTKCQGSTKSATVAAQSKV